MKVAIVHISDFHVKAGEHFINEKISMFLDSLNTLGTVHEYAIVFSGDLADSGQINEYKSSRYIIGKIIEGIKQKNNGKFVDVLIVPGNHDLTLNEESRDRAYIQQHYDDNCIESIVADEIKLLENFYAYSHANSRVPYDKIINRRFCSYGDYRIQFNLINTSLFSTLKPDDKELHYFPQEKMQYLKKADNVDLCVTVMHHSWEWFNWEYKSDLEKTIINNSEILFSGHDHCDDMRTVTIENNLDTWISCAGEMKFSDLNFQDSFNAIVVNTDANNFCGYIFDWNLREKIFVHKTAVENKPLQSREGQLGPLPSFIKELKEDTRNSSEDFTKYFVFPKLISECKNEFGKYVELKTIEELLEHVNTKKKLLISGPSNSGKSTLLKYLYCAITGNKIPLLLFVDSTTRIKPKNFIKRLFEDQYGDNPILFERYKQAEKKEKVLVVDGWEKLLNSRSREQLLQMIEEEFEYIIFSVSNGQQSIIESIKDEINKEQSFQELYIKPFFAKKRSQLVRNICLLNSLYNGEDIERVNRLIDSLVQNNINLFSLNPGFIIRYTDYFIKEHYYDYTKGEAIFSKVFEYELQRSIMEFTKRTDVDEVLTVFEEIAGYMYKSHNDILRIEDVRKVIEGYNTEYGIKVNPSLILEIGKRSKLFKETDDLSIYFANKNYLAYFIAKYLLRIAQNDDQDYSGIKYALKNICFGINSDIILFISYLSSNTKTVMSIAAQAGELLSPWEEIDFSKNNIAFLRKCKLNQIQAPAKEDHDRMKQYQENAEETRYNNSTVEAKGLFEYDESDIDEYPYRLIRAIKYTEMICKALPAFNSSLKLPQKEQIIESIYSYPHKITFAMLKPIDEKIEMLCDELLAYAQKNKCEKKDGVPYSKDNILDLFVSYSNAMILSIYDHFSELCTSPKTIDLLSAKSYRETNKQLERLMIIENSGNTKVLMREAEGIIKTSKDKVYNHMVRLVVRKHLLCNPELPFNKRQQIVDKFFGKEARKTMLLPSRIKHE
ncbi:MAG TPA: metallophosphoesterase [Chitinophagaceae bacterium]|nr:metallophosphoesterase [Chitinophagaceae bacterium]